MSALVCVARIGAAHGVRGAVKLWTFTEDPFAVRRYGPLLSKDGRRQFEVAQAREAQDHLAATDGDEYYHTDLIGLAAVTTGGDALGRVLAIHNFGAGDIIEIAPPKGPTMLLPFSNAVVPEVDLKAGRVVIALPLE